MKVPKQVERELNATGLEWGLDKGGQHFKIRLAGQLVGILPKSGKCKEGGALNNIIAQIRRAAKELEDDHSS